MQFHFTIVLLLDDGDGEINVLKSDWRWLLGLDTGADSLAPSKR